MREILFKAKRLDNGEWVEGSLLEQIHDKRNLNYYVDEARIVEHRYYIAEKTVSEHWEGCGMDEHTVTDQRKYLVDPETICQYTGVKDDNGKKIWENDIVRLIYWLRNIKEWVVEHKDGCMALKQIGVDYYAPLSDFNDKVEGFEVIGNIFDNPEFLEEVKNE